MGVGRGSGIGDVKGHKKKGALIERRGDNVEMMDKNYLENKFGSRGFRFLKLLL
jgi:hypothetical protein